ncbi:MAG: dihydrolipoyllysine-residue succinyltransferase [Candidatus Dadabacteria bacterium]
MPTKIVVPQLGESIVEATVRRWLKQEGDSVSIGDALVELETEKVNVEVAAEQSGVLVRIEKKEGDDVRVGDVLGLIEEAAQQGTKKPATKPKEAAKEEKPSERFGKTSPAVSEEPRQINGQKRVTPLARRMAEEYKVDLNEVSGTGPSNRVTEKDVEDYIEGQKSKQEGISKSETPQKDFPPIRVVETQKQKTEPAGFSESPVLIDRSKREERVRMSRRRRTIARRMVEAQQTAAMLTTFNEADMSAVMEIRKRRKDIFKQKYGVGLGIVSFFIKASIGALKDFPLLNAEIQGDDIILKHYYDIGVAIGAEEGLVVPVLRDADRMSFAEIERGIQEYAEKAKKGTFSLEDLMGGTFTVTNGGVFGSLLSTPIINPPQVGILGLHKIEERPVVVNSQVVVRPMMYLALSYDHRIVDGREAVQFLVRVKQLIEDPEALLLEG